MFETLITAGSRQSKLLTEVVLATMKDHIDLRTVFILNKPETKGISQEVADVLSSQHKIEFNFHNLSTSSDRTDRVQEDVDKFLRSILSQHDKRKVVVDLTAGNKATAQLLYILANRFGIKNFQVLARTYLDVEADQFNSLIKGKDYELKKLPSIKSSVKTGGFPLEVRAELDSEIVFRCSQLLENQHYEDVIVNAFKILDNRIRVTTGEPPEVYGEELINKAFSPEKGSLAQGLTPSEKIGLRNLISGANAFFRNPAAHRFVSYDQSTVETIITLVSFFLRIIETARKSRTA